MKILLTILLSGLAVAAIAQEAEVDIDGTYFHPAASMYVHGNSAGASNLVSTGLAQFPDNGKLLRLKELLDQQQEQEQNQDQNDEQNEDQQDQQQDQQDQDDQQQNDDPQDQDQNDDQNQDQQDQNQDQQDQQDDPSQQEQQPPSAEQMSQDEAERLLDAMKQEEETKRLQLHPVMGAPVKVDKDW